MQNTEQRTLRLAGSSVDPFKLGNASSRFDLALFISERDNRLEGLWRYNAISHAIRWSRSCLSCRTRNSALCASQVRVLIHLNWVMRARVLIWRFSSANVTIGSRVYGDITRSHTQSGGPDPVCHAEHGTAHFAPRRFEC